MKERPPLGVLSVACLIFSMSLFAGTLVFQSDVASAYAPHAPILIDGNVGFTAANGVTGGSGTPSDPYIIEGWDIDASIAVGIDIRNTDVHFIIRDSFTHSGGITFIGISLWNVTNGAVINNTVSGNRVGVSVRSAIGNTLSDNVVRSNGVCGIQLSPSSNNNTLVNNTVSTNSWGICISASDGNTLVYNTAISNTRAGIDISGPSSRNLLANNNVSKNYRGLVLSSSNNTIVNNTVDSNQQAGILLSYSSGNTLANNSMLSDGIMIDGDQLGHWNTHYIDTSNTVNGKPVYYWKNQSGGAVPLGAGEVILANSTRITIKNQDVSSGSAGVLLGFSNNNSLINNTASYNFYGIHTCQSNNNTFAGNNASNNEMGIDLYFSTNNTLVNNTANANYYYGIALSYSYTNTLMNNTVSDNGDGIHLDSSSNNTLVHNTLSSNWAGISLDSSDNNTIANNSASWNDDGIRLLSSDINIITHNIASHNIYGIYLVYSSGNTIANNIADSNIIDGIFVSYSGSNVIANNSASSNNACGIYLAYSNSTTLENNTMVSDGIVIVGGQLEHWNTHDIDTSNTVNGKPVYYWKNQSGGAVPLGAGEVILANSTRITVEKQGVGDGTVGILLGFSSNNSLANNFAGSNRWTGILLFSSSNNTLANNTASLNLNYGIYLDSSRDNTLADNDARRNSYGGIHLYYSYNNTLVNNIASNNGGGGIYLSFSRGSTIVRNAASSNGQSSGIYLGSSGSSTIANNIFSNNRYGIRLEYSENGTITNNTVSNNQGYGVYLSYSGGSTLAHNTVSSNGGVGIYLQTSGNSLAHHNNLIGNAAQAYDDAGPENSWDDGYPSGGNYWSDYAGVDRFSGPNQDLPWSDGIGDTPYIIDSDSRDRYPLMTPVGAQLSDLIVTPLNISFSQPPPLQEGSSAVINATIWNLGSASSKQTTVRFYDGFPPSLQIGSDQVLPPLPAGSSTVVSVIWTPSVVGSHDVCVVVDPGNLVQESNEINNAACITVDVVFSRQVTPGHRFMSFPVMVSDDSIGAVLSSISGCYDYVRWYDPLDAASPWKSYVPGRGHDSLHGLDNTMGFWINITAACAFTPAGARPSVTTLTLRQGWNMVGFPSFNTSYTVADLKADIGLAGIVVETFDSKAPSYHLQRISDSYVMAAGEGYWVYVPSDATWNVQG